MESANEICSTVAYRAGWTGAIILFFLFVAFMFLPGCTGGYGAGEEAQAPPSATPSSNVVTPALGATTTVI